MIELLFRIAGMYALLLLPIALAVGLAWLGDRISR